MRTLARTAACCLSLALGAPAQNGPETGAASAKDATALLPDSALVVLDGTDFAAFVGSLHAVYGAVVRGLDAPYRPIAGLLEGLAAGAFHTPVGDLVDGAISGPWAIALIWVGDRVEPVLVVHVRDAAPEIGAHPTLPLSVQDGVLVAARSAEHCARYHRWRKGGAATLASRAAYLAHRAPRPEAGEVRVWIDVATLRAANPPKPLDAGAKYFVGPNAAAVAGASRFDGTISLGARGVALRGKLDASALDAARPERRVLAAGAEARALPPAPTTAFAMLALDRRPAGFWQNLDALLTEAEVVQAQAFLSIADTLVGASFTDVFAPSLSGATFFAIDAQDEDAPKPVLDLPAFAIVSDVVTEKAPQLLRHLFMALATISRPERMQRGEVAFNHRIVTSEGGERLDVAEPDEWRGQGAPPTESALSPTLVCTEKQAVVATTRKGAEELLGALHGKAKPEVVRGDVLRVDPVRTAAYLRRNKDALVLGKMLDEGASRAQSTQEWNTVMALLEALASFELAWRPARDATEIELTIGVGDG